MNRSIAYALAACLLLAGCSTYSDKAVLIKDALAQDQFDTALELIEEIDDNHDRLLYLYEKGLVLHKQGLYTESNEALEAAELLFDDLYTKSLVREAGAFIISDQVTSFRGEAFETTYVNYFKMLNYWYLGSTEGALIEARRLNDKIKFLPDAEDSIYVESPFLQWMSGMFFEGGKERGDADVSYRRAMTAYNAQSDWLGIAPPNALACDLVANGEALGDREARARYGDPCASEKRFSSATAASRVTLFLECGYVAGKRSQEIVIPIYKGETDGDDYDDNKFAEDLVLRVGQPRRREKLDYVLKVALPGLPTPASAYDHVHLRATSKSDTLEQDLILAEDLNVWARRAFDVKMPGVMFRAILRGLIKYSAKKAADKKDTTLGIAMNILGAATERADTRNWSTLPERIFVSHLTLPEGTWKIELEIYNPMGQRVAWLDIPELTVTAGQRSFLNYRIH